MAIHRWMGGWDEMGGSGMGGKYSLLSYGYCTVGYGTLKEHIIGL